MADEPEYVYLTLRVLHGDYPPWGRRLAWLLKIVGRFGFKNEGCSTQPLLAERHSKPRGRGRATAG